MGSFTASRDKGKTAGMIDDLNVGIGVSSAFGIFNPALYIAVADMNKQKREINRYLDNLDLLNEYSKKLNENWGFQREYENNLLAYQNQLKDLERDKIESEEWLEDYEQMLAGVGDNDNLLLQQDKINQQNIANAEKDLAAYKDSSALELDSLIKEGFSQYTSQKQQQALQSVYAGASGSVVGSYNNAAKRVHESINATFGEDGFASSSSGAGSFSLMMKNNRQIVANQTAKLDTELQAARLAYNQFRDTAKDTAEDNQQFLNEDYESQKGNLEENIDYVQGELENLQKEANDWLSKAEDVLEDVHAFEEKNDFEKSEWTWGNDEKSDVDKN